MMRVASLLFTLSQRLERLLVVPLDRGTER
jgi:hypothetical protein